MDESIPINTPINEPPTEDHSDAEGKQEELETKQRRTSLLTIIVITAVLTSFSFQGLAIWSQSEKILVIISAVTAVVVSGTAAAKQIVMQRLDTLRVVHNKIRIEVNRFMIENNKLTRNVDGLEDNVIQLQHIEQHLQKIAEQQSSSAHELVALVKENKEILKQQKIMAKADLQEQLLATVLRTDRDGDLQINDHEANVLIIRMKTYDGVHFNEEQVRNALVTTNGSLPALLEIIRQIAADDDEDYDDGDGDDGDDGSDNDEEANRRGSKQMRRASCSKRMVRIDDRKFMESVIHQYSSNSSINFGESRAELGGSMRGSLLGDVSKQSLMENSG